jgi:eukaryotic-like serine/threonine-protein kinase
VVGETVLHYKIIEKLGEGGMGVVYKAYDTKLDRSVALKFLPLHLASIDTERERFIREARAASSLDHPNICTIYEVIETSGGDLVIVMPAYEGTPLDKKIQQGPLKIDDVIDISIQIADGLNAAHEKDIIHRDLKGSNIVITPKGQVKIIDFGLAWKTGTSRLTKTGSTLGTVHYMSPEQARGEILDKRTDVWALGVIMYEMISGRLPFQSDYSDTIIYSILREEPEPLSSIRSDVPPELERIVNKALQKAPQNRYQSIDELKDDLISVRKEIESPDSKMRTTASIIRKKVGPLYFKAGIAAAILIAIFIALFLLFLRTPATDIRSIAVLPLTNLSGDPEQEYFSDGITEALITDLAQLNALRVISRTSIMQYKEVNKPLSQIARELNVDAIIEGSVLRSENQVRITAHLIDMRSNKSVWASSYTRDLSDIVRLHGEIAAAIAGEIKIKLTPQNKARFIEAREVHPDAYEAVLMGKYLWNRRTPETLMRALSYLDQAIEIDPNYAEAYRWKAGVYFFMAVFFSNPKDYFPLARVNMEKAIELDERVIGGHVGLGIYYLFYRWDWPTAERHFNRAIEIDPGLELVYNTKGLYLSTLGLWNDAIPHFRKALEIDPLSLPINGDFGLAYYYMGRYDDAILQCKKTLEIDPKFTTSYSTIAAAYSQKEEYENAIAFLNTKNNGSGVSPEFDPPVVVAELGYAYGKMGRSDNARQIYTELLLRSEVGYIDPYLISLVSIGLGDIDESFVWLDKAIDARSPRITWLDLEPKFDHLRSDPRFTALREKANFIK